VLIKSFESLLHTNYSVYVTIIICIVTSVFYTVVWRHKSCEVENECTSHKFILLASLGQKFSQLV